MAPNFADLKNRAQSAATNLKDRYQSPSSGSATTYPGQPHPQVSSSAPVPPPAPPRHQPPPPPPSRTGGAPPPPPPSRNVGGTSALPLPPNRRPVPSPTPSTRSIPKPPSQTPAPSPPLPARSPAPPAPAPVTAKPGSLAAAKKTPPPPPPSKGAKPSPATPPPKPPTPNGPSTPPIFAGARPVPGPGRPGIAVGNRFSGPGSDGEEKEVDFRKLSREDKEGMFGLLDEFFARRKPTDGIQNSQSQVPQVKESSSPAAPTPKPPTRRMMAPPPPPPAEEEEESPPPPPQASRTVEEDGPPPPVLWARPTIVATPPPAQTNPMPVPALPQTPIPPEDPTQCSAFAICQFFGTSWPYTASPWYTSPSPLPPPLQGRQDFQWTGSWSSLGTSKSLIGALTFQDLSRCWYTVRWDESRGPGGAGNCQGKDSWWRPRPGAWDGDLLRGWSKAYGEMVAGFGEQAEASGQPVGRGECWDMANEALNYIQTSWPDFPRPVPSIGRTHGHLIYYGKVDSSSRQPSGHWRGGDDRIRRGDIVEWRRVTIKDGYATFSLGDPDHTALVLADVVPSSPTPLTDGTLLPPSSIGTLLVVEQSAGKAPSRQTYNLSGLQQGEVWVYRPVGHDDYLGGPFEAESPPTAEGIMAYQG